jgi:predicted short-subunit dehydrogenase-like oxidoreductase (DUF2520 family)
MDRITIIGKSKVGTALANALRGSERYKLSSIVSARMQRYPVIQSDVIIIAAKDEAIAQVSKKALTSALKPPKLMVHLAGSLAPSVLPSRKGMARLTLHPIQTFSEPNSDLLRGIFWMASSESPTAIRWARHFIVDVGGKSLIVLPGDSLPLYHAMTVFSSNFITLLWAAIEEISEELGQNPKRLKAALRPLAEKALENALSNPAREVLTGPFARKDFETIEKHQKALKALDPKLRAIYDGFLSFGLKSGTTKR